MSSLQSLQFFFKATIDSRISFGDSYIQLVTGRITRSKYNILLVLVSPFFSDPCVCCIYRSTPGRVNRKRFVNQLTTIFVDGEPIEKSRFFYFCVHPKCLSESPSNLNTDMSSSLFVTYPEKTCS